MLIYSRGQLESVTVRGFKEARRIGEYMNAVRRFLATNDARILKPFVGQSVTDSRGISHPFEVQPNTLYRLVQSGDGDFTSIYDLGD
jgi:hypothetical protein